MSDSRHMAGSVYRSPVLAVGVLLVSSVIGLVAEDSWPMWRRDSKGGTVPGEPTLQDPQITQASRLWISEDDLPPGRRGGGDDGRDRDGLANMERPLTGGYGSPVAAAGMVFQYHYRPSGTVYDGPRARGLGMSQEELRAQQPEMTGNIVRGHERWLVSATDRITAIDMETGKTVWRTDLTDEGLNFGFFGKGGGGLTPAYHDGMIMSYASSAQVFGLDAASGEIRWTYNLVPRYEQHRAYRKEALEGNHFAARFNRGMLTGLVAADGLVIVNDQRWHRVQLQSGTTNHYDTFNSYVALDVKTGEPRWEAPEVGDTGSNPKIVNIAGKNYVLAVSRLRLTLLDLASGRQIWQSDVGHDSPTCAFNLGVSDQYVVMAARQQGVDGRYLKGYRIDLEGLHELWSWGRIREFRSNALIVNDIGYMTVNEQLRAFDPQTGTVLAEVPVGDIRPAGGNPFVVYYGGWLFLRARGYGEDGLDGLYVMNADPEKMAGTKRFYQADLAQPYYCLIIPAFANGTIFFRTDLSNKMEAYRLR